MSRIATAPLATPAVPTPRERFLIAQTIFAQAAVELVNEAIANGQFRDARQMAATASGGLAWETWLDGDYDYKTSKRTGKADLPTRLDYPAHGDKPGVDTRKLLRALELGRAMTKVLADFPELDEYTSEPHAVWRGALRAIRAAMTDCAGYYEPKPKPEPEPALASADMAEYPGKPA